MIEQTRKIWKNMARAQTIVLLLLIFLLVLSNVVAADDLEKAMELNEKVKELFTQGRYEEALPLAQEALSLEERTLGTEHLVVANGLDILAVLYHELGEYAQAEPLYKRSLAIKEKALGPEHLDVALTLDQLASIYYDLRDYSKLEPLYKRSLVIKEKTLGAEHPDVIYILIKLAYYYLELGDYTQAEPLFKRLLDICEKSWKPEHPDILKATYLDTLMLSLNGLAIIYMKVEDYAKAELLLKRSVATAEKNFSQEDIKLAVVLRILADLYTYIGNYDQAEQLFEKSLAIFEKTMGKEHQFVANVKSDMGLLYTWRRDYEKSERFLKQSLAILEKTMASDHPGLAMVLDNLAQLKVILADYKNAKYYGDRALAIQEKSIERVFAFTSERQKSAYLKTLKLKSDAAYTLVSQYLAQDSEFRRTTMNLLLARKGIVLEAMTRQQEIALFSNDPQLLELYQKLTLLRGKIATATNPLRASLGKEDSKAYRDKLKKWEEEKENLEAELARKSQPFAAQKKTRKADTVLVAGLLPKDAVLIEMVCSDMYNFFAQGKKNQWLPAHYLVFILYPDNTTPTLIDLGKAEVIDQAVREFRQALQGALADINKLGETKAEALLQTKGQVLYKLVFTPIEINLQGKKRLLISPDGELNLIPFEVLFQPSGRYLVEDYEISYLSSGRDLVRYTQPYTQGKGFEIYADPNFDLGEEGYKKQAALIQAGKTPVAVVRHTTLRPFLRLPETAKEAQEIYKITKAHLKKSPSLHLQDEALEELLKRVQAPAILHLATHGFFLEDAKSEKLTESIVINSMFTGFAEESSHGLTVKLENPLLRSGLALAGANWGIKRETITTPDLEDGLLTAEDVCGINLQGTELVVLSACETGLGEVKRGEGVFGLRRAFVLAGARTLVMSLWKVPDKETQELMGDYYQRLLKGEGKASALRNAQLAMIKTRRQADEADGGAHPFFWGAFVTVGEAGPLKLSEAK